MIRKAFAGVEYPGDWCLRGSNEGDEPYLLEEEFKGKTDWTIIDPEFLDQAPDGYSSALSFFSDGAFRFYLPAYMIADIDGHLKTVDVLFHLTHGLTDRSKTERLNPRRYSSRTWFEARSYRYSVFCGSPAKAIVAYLEYKRETEDFNRDDIDQAIANFWRSRTEIPDDIPEEPKIPKYFFPIEKS